MNEAFARQFFPGGENPVGKRIGYGARVDGAGRTNDHYWHTIVGIVSDTREQLSRRRERPHTRHSTGARSVHVFELPGEERSASCGGRAGGSVGGARVRPESTGIAPASRRSRHAGVDCDAAVHDGHRGDVCRSGAHPCRGGNVWRHEPRGARPHEGNRRAHGAGGTRRGVVALVLGEAAVVVLISTAVGLAAAAALGSSIQALLYEVQPRDPLTMAVSAALLAAVALAASYIPIRRMLAQNPLTSLPTRRSECEPQKLQATRGVQRVRRACQAFAQENNTRSDSALRTKRKALRRRGCSKTRSPSNLQQASAALEAPVAKASAHQHERYRRALRQWRARAHH